MKKKILAVLLSAAMVAAMAMGCSSGGGTSAKADGEKAGKAEDIRIKSFVCSKTLVGSS